MSGIAQTGEDLIGARFTGWRRYGSCYQRLWISKLHQVPKGPVKLKVNYVGFESRTISKKLTGNETLSIELEATSEKLQEVVNITEELKTLTSLIMR
ncbi:MAG: hypothetical protein AAGA64_14500 [Bacteroidota bacterium]